MTLVKHAPKTPVDVFDRFFGPWPEFFQRRPLFYWTAPLDEVIPVDEYQENGTRVIRAEMPGLDPLKDVELTVSDGVLHIRAERHEETEEKEKAYSKHELRYGSFARDLVLPDGYAEGDVKATYKDGILEVRVPVQFPEGKKPEAIKIPVTTA
jgi:HSP20 family protein